MTVLIDSYHCYLTSFLDYLSTKENKDIVYLQYGYLLGVIETFREEGFDITLKEVSINEDMKSYVKTVIEKFFTEELDKRIVENRNKALGGG